MLYNVGHQLLFFKVDQFLPVTYHIYDYRVLNYKMHDTHYKMIPCFKWHELVKQICHQDDMNMYRLVLLQCLYAVLRHAHSPGQLHNLHQWHKQTLSWEDWGAAESAKAILAAALKCQSTPCLRWLKTLSVLDDDLVLAYWMLRMPSQQHTVTARWDK